MSDPRGPVLGQSRVLGHDLIQIWPTERWWWARCECGEMFRGRREQTPIDHWNAHYDEEGENRGL